MNPIRVGAVVASTIGSDKSKARAAQSRVTRLARARCRVSSAYLSLQNPRQMRKAASVRRAARSRIFLGRSRSFDEVI
jgi:hypothetical protein